MSSEPIDELKTQISDLLENNGVLGTIRAQLRSKVIHAIDTQDKATGGSGISRNQAGPLNATSEDKVLAELVREYLHFHGLEHTASVFVPEAQQPAQAQSREDLANRLGVTAEAKKQKPLLALLLQANGRKDLGAASLPDQQQAPKPKAATQESKEQPSKAAQPAMPSVGLGKAMMETTHSRNMPWKNSTNEGTCEAAEPSRQQFLEVLKKQLEGCQLKKDAKNLYVAQGFTQAEGYEDASFGRVESELKQWCASNSQRHRQTGWILLTHGQLSHKIGALAASQGVHVVFLHHNKAWMPQTSRQWPQHTSGGCFLPATPALESGRVDEEILQASFGGEVLMDYLGGVFCAGGSAAMVEQASALGFTKARPNDRYVPAKDKDSIASPLDAKFAQASQSLGPPGPGRGGLGKMPGGGLGAPGKLGPPLGGGLGGGLGAPLGALGGGTLKGLAGKESSLGGLPGLKGMSGPASLAPLGKAPPDPFAARKQDHLSPTSEEDLIEDIDIGEESLSSPLKSTGEQSWSADEAKLREIEEQMKEKLKEGMKEVKLNEKEVGLLNAVFVKFGTMGATHPELCKVLRDNQEASKILSRGLVSKEGKATMSDKEVEQIWLMMGKDPDETLPLDEVRAWWKGPWDSLAPSAGPADDDEEEIDLDLGSPLSVASDNEYEDDFDDDQVDEFEIEGEDVSGDHADSPGFMDSQGLESMSMDEMSQSFSPVSSGLVEDHSASYSHFDKAIHVEDADQV